MQEGALNIKPTGSGRLMLGSALRTASRDDLAKELYALAETSDIARQRMTELAEAVNMGVKLRLSNAPAFVGLAVIDVVSATLPGYRHPMVQVSVEDDKVRLRLLLLPCRPRCHPHGASRCRGRQGVPPALIDVVFDVTRSALLCAPSTCSAVGAAV